MRKLQPDLSPTFWKVRILLEKLPGVSQNYENHYYDQNSKNFNRKTLLYEMFPLWPGTIPHSSDLPDLGFFDNFFSRQNLMKSSLECRESSHNNKTKRSKFLLEFLAEWDFFFGGGILEWSSLFWRSIFSVDSVM